jgi:general secretion pathway protein D
MMHTFKFIRAQRGFAVTLALCLAAFIYWCSLPFVMAADIEPAAKAGPAPNDASESKPSGSDTNAPATAREAKKSPDDLIQLSFQGANIDMVVQWLAETTGKSVVKHPQAQCQLTIVGSKKVTRKEAITLVYRALALEGFTAIESAKAIMIVPQDKEPKLSPEMADGAQAGESGSHGRLVKVFALHHAQARLLKDKIKSVLTEKATVDVDEQANALVVTDYHDNVTVAGQLISQLDTDKPQDVMVRVISLKNANAAELAKELEPFYGRPGTEKENKEVLQISANDRSNSLLVYSSETTFKIVEQLVSSLDTEDAQEKVMRSFVIKNADANDVAKQLQDLYKESSDNNNGFRYWYFNSSDSENGNSKKLSVVADRRRNAIIVQAAPIRMDSIAKMVEALDEPVNDDSLAPKIYVLKYVSAADIEDVLNELFLKKTTQQRPYWFDEEPQQTADRDVGRLYGKVRITSEPYSNAIIVTSNSRENLAAVEQVLRQLDVPSEAGETTFRIGLRFADANTMANSINVLFAKGGSPPMHQQPNNNQNQPNQNQQNQQGQTQQSTSQSNFEVTEQAKDEGYFPWLGGQPDNPRSNDTRAQRPVSDLIGRVRVVPDQRSNSLLISANVHFFPEVLKLIQDMDVPTPEVMIEARIVEVSSDFLEQLGVRWSPNGSATFTANDADNGIVASGNGQYQSGFGGKSAVNTPASSGSASSIAQALTTLRTGMVNNTLSMDFLIQFLREHTDATVLADPQLEIGDNELGKLFVGQRVPVSTGTVIPSVGGSSSTTSYQDVGVILEVEPHINDSGDVTLRISTESSTIASAAGVQGSPIFNTANFRTQLTATNGQTLILGGIIQKQSNMTLRKTPILGSIPGVKWAFNKKDNSNQQTELLVFMRPKITRTPQEAHQLLEEVNKRMPLIEKWEKEQAADATRPSAKSPPPGKH